MKKQSKWMLAAILTFSGTMMLTSCTEKDNPILEPEQPQRNEQRVKFEQQLSADLDNVMQFVNLNPTLKAIRILTSFTNNLESDAIGQQGMDILNKILTNVYAANPTCQLLTFDQLGDKQPEALKAVKSQLGLEDVNNLMLINAYNSIGTRHMTFKPGEKEAIITEDDALVLEYQDGELGETTEVRLKFSAAEDGVILFAAKLLGVPVAVQLPSSIDVTISTGKTGEPKEIMTGTLTLMTTDGTKYISFKDSGWYASINLRASVVGRTENIHAYASHSTNGELNVTGDLDINDQKVFSLGALGVLNPYTAEEMEQLKELRDFGAAYSAAYDVLKAFNGRNIDALTMTVNDNLTVTCKVSDIAEGLKALGNIHLLHAKNASQKDVDAFTQKLNKVLKFRVNQKNTGITAEGSLLTIMKGSEYQPAVALRFEGESEFQPVISNMSQHDLENYEQLISSFQPAFDEFNLLLDAIQAKGKAIKNSFGF